jgi:L-fuculose-phosphate aldolase
MRARDAARALARTARRLWEAGLIAGADGNISVRLGPDRLMVTPRGLLKSELTPADMVEVALDGRRLRGFRRASSELDLHLRVYRQRPSCGAVIHAHPPTATGFAVAGIPLDTDVLAETVILLGAVPIVTYAQTGTVALGDRVEPLMASHHGVLLANHGAVTWGPDLAMARIRMESLEHAARILLTARHLGRVRRLTRRQVAALALLREGNRDG